MLIIDGLNAIGEVEFAQELSCRFCEMVVRSGMAENFDAISGEGLRDRAYSWTSSVFLILAHEYCGDTHGAFRKQFERQTGPRQCVAVVRRYM